MGVKGFFIQIDDTAFAELYERHSRVVYSLALRIVHEAATAEEVVNEVFVLVWRNAPKYHASRGPFLPWLLTLTRHKALDRFRLKSERQRYREDQADEFPPAPDVCDYEASLDNHRRFELVRLALAELSRGQRTAIELAYFEELSQTEIAARLGVPLGTVKSWIRGGILRIKQGLLTSSVKQNNAAFRPHELPCEKGILAWQGAYQCAVLETNPAQMAQRIDDALRAIEQRVGSTIRIDNAENEAIEFTRNALAVLRGEWLGGLSESMNGVVPQKELKLNLFRNSRGKTELLGTFPDAASAKARLKEHMVVSSGYYVIYDQMGEKIFADGTLESS